MKSRKDRAGKQGAGFNEGPLHLNPVAREIRRLCRKAVTGAHLLGYTLLFSHVSFIPYAHAAPTGGTVVGGSGTIQQSGLTTDIYQQSASLAVDWSSYNLSSNEIVNYYQPDSSSLALNRILSNDPSRIYGQINANGQVILVNPNGIFFGDSASVNVGGLIASGLDISPDDFMNGNYLFNEVLGTSGTVINSGLINAATGGNVTLLGKQVQNQGVISAKLGAMNMAAGKQAFLTFDSQGLIGVSVTREVLQDELGVDPAILNSGEINASGGRILLTASQSRDIFSRAVNTGDINQATSAVVNEDGSFDLTGGADVLNSGTLSTATTEANADGGDIALLGQNVTSSGRISADAQQGSGGNIELHSVDTTRLSGDSLTSARAETTGQGGSVKILGDKVGLFGQSRIDVSGANGGGLALIGGDYQGKNPLIRNASRTYIGTGTQIRADAIQNGDGGRIINWGNDYTWFYGSASAKGGANSGDGGFVEISGKGLSFDGSVDTNAANGYLGMLLFDPMDIVVHATSEVYGAGNNDELDDNEILWGDVALSGTFDITEGKLEGLSNGANIVLAAARDITMNTLDGGGLEFTNNISSLTILADANHDGDGAFSMDTSNAIITHGGSVSIEGATITAGAITTTGAQGESGGAVTLTSTATSGAGIQVGAIITTGGTAWNGSNGEVGGNVTLASAGGAIATGSINSSGSDGSGNSDDGGAAGTIDISNSGSIAVTGSLTAIGGDAGASNATNGAGGDITITGISVDGSWIPSQSLSEPSGAVSISGNIVANRAAVTITAESISAGNITTTGNTTMADDQGQSGGGVALKSTTETGTGISVGAITTKGGTANSNGENGGNVLLASAGGAIATGSIDTSGSAGDSGGDDGGNAGTIGIYSSGAITFNGALTANGGISGNTAYDNDGVGGAITIAGVTIDGVSGIPSPDTANSAGVVQITGAVSAYGADVSIDAASITASNIDTSGAITDGQSGSPQQNGGAVELAATGNIAVGAIATDGGTATNDAVARDAGDVTITTVSGGIVIDGAISAQGGGFEYVTYDTGNGGAGGNVTLNSDSGAIAVTGAINTSGSVANGDNNNGGNAGDIHINSLSGTIALTSLTTNGGGETNNGTGGGAGHIDLSTGSSAANAVTITGAVTANGGNSGYGTAGNADYIALHSDSGTMTIQGNVSATGAAAAEVTLSADTLQLSTTAAQSISGDTVTLTSVNPANAVQLRQNLTIAAATDALVNGNINYTGTGATLSVTADGDAKIDGISATNALNVVLTADNNNSHAGNVTVGGNVSTMGGNYQANGVDYVGSSNSIATYGGQVTIGAASVTTGSINTAGASTGGGVSIMSDTATYSPTSAGGITVGSVTATGNNSYAGGAVALATIGNGNIAVNGTLNTSGGFLTGNAGAIAVTSAIGDVSVSGNLLASAGSVGNAGAITLHSANGAVSVSGDMRADKGSLGGSSADVTITADAVQLTGSTARSISGEQVEVTSNSNPMELQHSLTVNAATDAIFDGDINYTGSGGALSVTANNDISIDGVASDSGALAVTLRADADHSYAGNVTVGGDVSTMGGYYRAYGVTYAGSTNAITTLGGQVTVDAAAIATGEINTIRAGGAGSLVRLTSNTAIYAPASAGGVTAGAIVTAGDTDAAGGDITVETLVAGDIDVSGSLVSAGGGTGATAGTIIVSSANGNVSVAGNVNANGDTVTATTGNANAIYLLALNGALSLQGSASATGATNADVTVYAQTLQLAGSAAQTISGNRVAISSATNPIELRHDLTVDAATDATFTGDINYTRPGSGSLNVTSNGDIMLDGISSSGGALAVTLAADNDNNSIGSATIHGDVTTHGGNYSVSGVNYDEGAYTVDAGGGNASITAGGNVVLGTMTNIGDLIVTAGGTSGITQANGTNLSAAGTSDLTTTASGANIVLSNAGNQLHGAIDANLSGNMALLNDGSLVIGSISSSAAQGTVALTASSGSITADSFSSGTNIMSGRVELKATTGIGGIANAALTTSASALNVQTDTGLIGMSNTGNVKVDMVRTGDGNILFGNEGTVTADRIATHIDAGHIDLTINNGSLLGYGSIPAYTYEDADIAGHTIEIIVNGGNLGVASRPLVVYAPGDINTVSVISFGTVYLPKTGRVGNITETALISFSATDTLAALAGEQVTEVENLDDVDPAIFTDVRNYNLSEISIRMPKDQLYGDEQF